MEQFDSLFFNVFNHYKTSYKSKANDIALCYIIFLQASFLLLFGTFLMLFFGGMNVDILSNSKAWVVYIMIVIALLFRNWIYYTGKKRKVLNTTQNKGMNRKSTSVWVLWMIPFACLLLSIIVMGRL